MAEHVTAADRALGQADVSLLGARVAAAAAPFVGTWSGDLSRLAAEATRHEQAIADVFKVFLVVDADHVQALRALLPWDARHQAPGAAS